MADTSVANTTAQLSGKTLVTAEGDWTITGLHSYSRGASAPFAVNSGAAVVTNLDADKLDGQDWTSPTISAPTITSPVINTALYSTKLIAGICEGRLTLTSGTPVTTADVTGAVSVFFTPYRGTNIALYDGTTNWGLFPFTEKTLALGTLTNDLPYDVFVYNNSGTITLEALAWSSKTARATALVLQDGVWSKTGALTRRYLGTFHTTSTTTTEDSLTKRLLWNYYNRVPRSMKRIEATASWNYTTATVRQANAAVANQLAVVIGVAEDAAYFEVVVTGSSSATSYGVAGIGEDSTTTFHTSSVAAPAQSALANAVAPGRATLRIVPAVGYHFYAWLEWAQAAGTFTWWSSGWGPTSNNAGMTGVIQG